MAENTKIEWATHTFNPWIGCSKVSPGCDHCYAETWGKRFGVRWGPNGSRRRTSPDNWKEPLKWNRKAKREGTRPRVFCASLADVFDPAVSDGWRDELMSLILQTPHLDWLLLTKRPEVMRDYFNAYIITSVYGDRFPLHNIWLGVTAENQEQADERIPVLLGTPAAKRFVSIEPLLSMVDLTSINKHSGRPEYDALCGLKASGIMARSSDEGSTNVISERWPSLDWVIVGGESGPKARPMNIEWIHDIYQQCKAANVPFFFKQWGEWVGGTANGQGWYIYHDGTFSPNWDYQFGDGGCAALRVGKKQAGHKLGGRVFREFPGESHASV